MDWPWVAIGMVALGVAMWWFGGPRTTNTMNVRGSSGTFIQGTQGDVNIGGPASSSTKPSGREQFFKWVGLAISFAGLVLAGIKLWMG